ncbi:hypothetical protein [Gimesia chilikensis]|uniref:hypothetical protein n=1 Tax=Gimesia chilikensis TaxID=2605989 RepID=UPI00118B175A|nr:hypothetical protein [Gimesia chilikensis]QDT84684.1 hypothetical protein MalM14_23460 [Gimesia chilikensis]
MNDTNELDFDLGSLLPSVTLQEVAVYENQLSNFLERTIRFPEAFVQVLLHFHGGIPGKQCFRSRRGEIRMICRFCNIFNCLGDDRLPPPSVPSWRPGGAEDDRLDYSIDTLTNRFDYSGRLYTRGEDLVPIAAIDTAGHNAREMSEMNLLCLKYGWFSKPSVVTWSFEESWADRRETVKVARSLDQFLTKLFPRPDGFPITNECEYF